jgi:hypothetical protein
MSEDDSLPACTLLEWIEGMAGDRVPDNERLSAASLRMCMRDDRDQARRFLALHGDALKIEETKP